MNKVPVLEVAKEIQDKYENYSIHTFGIGSETDKELVRSLADEGRGTWSLVNEK